MSSQLVGYWSEDRWDIRKCPHPSAIDLSKNPSLKNRWVNFESVENIWLRTELKYFLLSLNKWNMECKNVLDKKGDSCK